MSHGTHAAYVAGCHCMLCRKGHSDYVREQKRRAREAPNRERRQASGTCSAEIQPWGLCRKAAAHPGLHYSSGVDWWAEDCYELRPLRGSRHRVRMPIPRGRRMGWPPGTRR
jgi:hypothetical protein